MNEQQNIFGRPETIYTLYPADPQVRHRLMDGYQTRNFYCGPCSRDLADAIIGMYLGRKISVVEVVYQPDGSKTMSIHEPEGRSRTHTRELSDEQVGAGTAA